MDGGSAAGRGAEDRLRQAWAAPVGRARTPRMAHRESGVLVRAAVCTQKGNEDGTVCAAGWVPGRPGPGTSVSLCSTGILDLKESWNKSPFNTVYSPAWDGESRTDSLCHHRHS